jgi:prolyl-tRNA editing enzyme YbaK/EbsC (Cys-tRNA(Pro) deacylase)
VIGGVPPVGHEEAMVTIIGEDLLTLGDIWAAADTPNAVFKLNAANLEALTGGIVMAIR